MAVKCTFSHIQSFISNAYHITVLFNSFSAVLVCLPFLGSQLASCNQMGEQCAYEITNKATCSQVLLSPYLMLKLDCWKSHQSPKSKAM